MKTYTAVVDKADDALELARATLLVGAAHRILIEDDRGGNGGLRVTTDVERAGDLPRKKGVHWKEIYDSSNP